MFHQKELGYRVKINNLTCFLTIFPDELFSSCSEESRNQVCFVKVPREGGSVVGSRCQHYRAST